MGWGRGRVVRYLEGSSLNLGDGTLGNERNKENIQFCGNPVLTPMQGYFRIAFIHHLEHKASMIMS